MTNNDNLKNFDDPLYAGLKRSQEERKKKGARQAPKKLQEGSNSLLILSIVLVVAIGTLGYFIYSAQHRIGELSTHLQVSQEQLGEVSKNLDESRLYIDDLNEGLTESKDKLQAQDRTLNRYQGLYQGLQREQEQASKEIQALGVDKADQTEVNNLRGETNQIKGELVQTGASLNELNTQTVQNREEIQQTRSELSSEISEVRLVADTNAGEIAAVKRSLEREYYNFELQERGGYMQVFEVSLSLQDTDVRRRQFDLYILADGKVIQKKDHSINEPIQFYVEGRKKPYEVVVTRVADRLVVGHLSIPKG